MGGSVVVVGGSVVVGQSGTVVLEPGTLVGGRVVVVVVDALGSRGGRQPPSCASTAAVDIVATASAVTTSTAPGALRLTFILTMPIDHAA